MNLHRLNLDRERVPVLLVHGHEARIAQNFLGQRCLYPRAFSAVSFRTTENRARGSIKTESGDQCRLFGIAQSRKHTLGSDVVKECCKYTSKSHRIE